MLLAPLALGLLGSPHCLLMCGGPCAMLAPPSGPRPLLRAAALHLGRAGGYAALGALAGALGAFAAGPPNGARVLALRGLAAVALLTAALSLAGLGAGDALGARFARLVRGATERLRRALAPLQGAPHERTARRSFALGLGWALAPCGLLYSALVLALAAGSALGGAAVMAAFALGTTPALFAVHAVAARLLRFASRRAVRLLAALALGLAAVVNLSLALDALRGYTQPGGDEPAAHCEPRAP